jgi:hypothetical protein
VVAALRTGKLAPTDLLFDVNANRWAPAKEHDAVQAVLAGGSTELAEVRVAPPIGSAEVSTERPTIVLPRLDSAPTEAPSSAELSRLKLWVGPNWESHYSVPFTRLLAARRRSQRVGWTWNWAAGLVPLWWIYRRLYGGFLLWLFSFGLLSGLEESIANDGGDPRGLLTILGLLSVVLFGVLGDRLLFNRGYRTLTGIGRSSDDATLDAHGRPNSAAIKWILGIWGSLIGFAILLSALRSLLQ